MSAPEPGLAALTEARRKLASSPNLGEALLALARLLVPRLADTAALIALDRGDRAPIFGIAHADPEQEGPLRSLCDRHLGAAGALSGLARGEPLPLARIGHEGPQRFPRGLASA